MPSSNPFSSRFIQPGAVDYQLPDEANWGELLSQLNAHRRCFVEGPHGAGKSTFVRSLINRWMTGDADDAARCNSATLVKIGPDRTVAERVEFGEENRAANIKQRQHLMCVDGWDHWTWWRRVQNSWSRQLLVATSHQGIPRWHRLHRPQTCLARFRAIVDGLQGSVAPDQRVSKVTIETAFARSEGNLREALFALYDDFESQSSVSHS